MTSLAVLKEKFMHDPEFKAEYDRLGPVYELVGAMADARHESGLTQAQVAALMGTTQSVIARLENARHLPSLDLLTRYAAALGRRVNISFSPAE